MYDSILAGTKMFSFHGLEFTGFKCNIELVSKLELAKAVRNNLKVSLSDSLKIATMLKESYRLGQIRGQLFK